MSAEREYLKLVQHVLDHGVQVPDRTGTGTLSVFGAQYKVNVSTEFPLLTTKRVPFKTMVTELKWFLSGCTDNRVLNANNVHIWDANEPAGSDGDLGPIYGFQWRHFGAEYRGCNYDYAGEGTDQLRLIIERLKLYKSTGRSEYSRRLIMSAWNPVDIDKMALPPCHMMCQFWYNPTTDQLSLQLYQRSADLGLGVPFNMSSYSLLLHLVAKICDMKPFEFTHTFGDAHVYMDHVLTLSEQLKREPFPSPRIEITNIRTLSDFDVELHGYRCHPSLYMKMSA